MRGTIFVLSAAVLAHEVCLLRAMAIAWYGHAAALVVAVAVLGFGAAGVLLAVVPRWVCPGGVAVATCGYAVSVPLSFRAAAGVDFDILQVGWDPTQWLRLLAVEAVFLVPFLLAGIAVAVALASWRNRAGAMYGANLLGSGVGAVLAAPLLALGPPEAVAELLALGAALGALALPGRRWRVLAVVAAVLVLALCGGRLDMSPFKDLPAAPGKRILETRYSVHGRVDLASVPSLHHAPGLSLTALALPPRQDGLFVDGHLAAALDRGDVTYLDETVGALPFVLRAPGAAPRVLLLGVGKDLARATFVVDPDAELLALAGRPGQVAPIRAWLRHAPAVHDVALLDVAGTDSVRETPLLTIEGLAAALAVVTPDGCLAASTPLVTPPRAGLKLLATAEAVTPFVVAVRSFDRLCVVLRHRPVPQDAWSRVHAFCDRLGFDVVRPLSERPERPRHETTTPLLDPGPAYPYDVSPATDARPYFHRVFRWSRLGDVLDRHAVPFVQWGFVAVLVAFVQVVLLSGVLLLLPLVLVRASRAPAPLFLALGVAYMLLEMAFLAQASVRLGSPTHAAAAVLGGFLVGSGVGSLLGESLGRPLGRPALAASVLALPVLLLLPGEAWLVGLASAAVALPMGFPFPAALGRLAPASVPWALAWNGCASVAAAAAAPLLASTVSIPATAAVGALLYLGVAAGTGRATVRAGRAAGGVS